MMKPGYKQTEIGVIPEDWEAKPLKDVAPLQRGFDLPYSQMEEGKYPVVFSNGVGAFHNAYMAKGPGVITGRSGTIGKVHYISTNYWPHNTTLWVTDFHGNDEKYVYYLFQTVPWELFNSGSSVPTLNRNDIHDTLHAIPPRPEQRRIAEALSDMDELIASLEKLIAKKKAIKQGAMQELLTGKRRLPGFSVEWKPYLYMDICSLINGRAYSQPELLNEGKYKVLRLGNLFTNEKWYYSDLELSEKQYCDTGDLIYAWSATFGPYIWEKERVIYHYHIWKVICSELVDKQFLYYYFLYDTQKIKNEVQGGTMAHLTKEAMEKRVCRIPSKMEQQEIGHILAAIDRDIQNLELKLAKAMMIKQGMMQQLLTGNIRF